MPHRWRPCGFKHANLAHRRPHRAPSIEPPLILLRRDGLHHKWGRGRQQARRPKRPWQSCGLWFCPSPHSIQATAGARYTGDIEAPEKRRWYCSTPAWLVLRRGLSRPLKFTTGAVLFWLPCLSNRSTGNGPARKVSDPSGQSNQDHANDASYYKALTAVVARMCMGLR